MNFKIGDKFKKERGWINGAFYYSIITLSEIREKELVFLEPMSSGACRKIAYLKTSILIAIHNKQLIPLKTNAEDFIDGL